jgi:hypothetical protein
MTIDNETLEKWAGLGPWKVGDENNRDLIFGQIGRCAVAITGELNRNYEYAALIAAAPTLAAEVLRLREVVELARDTFIRYGDLHAAKPDDAKAQANYNLAEIMGQALKGGDL